MRRTTYLVALVAIVVVSAAACGTSDPGVSSGTTSSAPGASGSTPGSAPAGATGALSLDGTRYVSTSVTGRDLVAGSTITMTFADGTVSVNAGCNTLAGSYTVDGTTLTVGADMAATMMACEDVLMAQDAWLTGWLTAGVTVATTADGISLTGDGVTVELAEEAGGPSVTSANGMPVLTGQTWTLHTLSSGGTASSLPAGVEAPTLVFAEDGTVAVFTGCNGGSTTAVVGEDGFITFEPMMTTMMACGEPADGVAATLTTLLDGRVAFAWDGSGDLVLSKDGESLIFTAG